MFETKCLEQSETRAFGPQGLLEYTLANFTVNLYLKTQKTFLKMLKLYRDEDKVCFGLSH